jgi:hypothetical protein
MKNEVFIEMIDEYLAGELDDSQVEEFEIKMLSSPECHNMVLKRMRMENALNEMITGCSDAEVAELIGGDEYLATPEDLLPLVEQLAPIASVFLDLGGAWRRRGAVSEEGLPQYKAGEELMLGLTMPWAGHLLIFLQGPDGLQIICPGTANTQTSYEKDASPVLSMNAAKDPGVYLLKAIAVPQEEVVNIGLELDSSGQLPLGIENAAQILGRLDQTKLSISEVRFEVVPKEG